MMNCATTWDPIGGGDYAVEPKFDGARLCFYRSANGVRAETRTGHDHTGKFPRIEAAMELLPIGTCLDGELVFSSGKSGWGHVQSAIGGNAKVIDANILYVVFDVMEFGDADVRQAPYLKRRELLTVMDEEFWEPDFAHCDPRAWVSLAPFWTRIGGCDIDRIATSLVHQGYEGAVFKRLDSPYRTGERHPDWMKWKPAITVDAMVTGTQPGKGKYAGLVGALEFGFFENGVIVETGKCSGMSDAQRVPGAIPIGSVIEVAHMGVTVNRKLRHPQFRRVRLDKVPSECGIEQLSSGRR